MRCQTLCRAVQGTCERSSQPDTRGKSALPFGPMFLPLMGTLPWCHDSCGGCLVSRRPDQQALRGMLEVDPEAVHASAAHTFGYGAIKGKEAEKPWPALQCEVGISHWPLGGGEWSC